MSDNKKNLTPKAQGSKKPPYPITANKLNNPGLFETNLHRYALAATGATVLAGVAFAHEYGEVEKLDGKLKMLHAKKPAATDEEKDITKAITAAQEERDEAGGFMMAGGFGIGFSALLALVSFIGAEKLYKTRDKRLQKELQAPVEGAPAFNALDPETRASVKLYALKELERNRKANRDFSMPGAGQQIDPQVALQQLEAIAGNPDTVQCAVTIHGKIKAAAPQAATGLTR